jgi:hypothetical protein
MGKGGARGLLPRLSSTKSWVVADYAGWCWVGWQGKRGENVREFGLEGKGRRWR